MWLKRFNSNCFPVFHIISIYTVIYWWNPPKSLFRKKKKTRGYLHVKHSQIIPSPPKKERPCYDPDTVCCIIKCRVCLFLPTTTLAASLSSTTQDCDLSLCNRGHWFDFNLFRRREHGSAELRCLFEQPAFSFHGSDTASVLLFWCVYICKCMTSL